MGKKGRQAYEKPRKKNDALLKGIFEENFPDFLRFLYQDADMIFSFDHGIGFMDKELHAIIPDRESQNDKRVADMLAKLYMKDGTERWILVKVEIEGGNDPEFAPRVTQYNYRIRNRYGVSVATIVVYTGDKVQRRPVSYRDELLGTVFSFSFLTYHIFDDREEELLEMANPFALVVVACRKALLEGKLPDEELGADRLTIAKALLSYGKYDNDRILSFLLFLKNFIYIDDKDINCNFDQQIEELTKGRINMGVIEVLKQYERSEGKLEGKLEGKQEEIGNLIAKLGLSDEQAADVAAVPVEMVREVRSSLKKNK